MRDELEMKKAAILEVGRASPSRIVRRAARIARAATRRARGERDGRGARAHARDLRYNVYCDSLPVPLATRYALVLSLELEQLLLQALDLGCQTRLVSVDVPEVVPRHQPIVFFLGRGEHAFQLADLLLERVQTIHGNEGVIMGSEATLYRLGIPLLDVGRQVQKRADVEGCGVDEVIERDRGQSPDVRGRVRALLPPCTFHVPLH